VKKSDIDSFENSLDSYLQVLRKMHKEENKKKIADLKVQINVYNKSNDENIGNRTIIIENNNVTNSNNVLNNTDKENIKLNNYTVQKLTPHNNSSDDIVDVKMYDNINVNMTSENITKTLLNQIISENKNSSHTVNKTNESHSDETHIHIHKHTSLKNDSLGLNSTNNSTNISSNQSVDNFMLSNNSIIDINTTKILLKNTIVEEKINTTNNSISNNTKFKLNSTTFANKININQTSTNKSVKIFSPIKNSTTKIKYNKFNIIKKPRNKGMDKIYQDLKTNKLNQEFEERESHHELTETKAKNPKVEKFLEVENLEYNIYKRIVNISLSLIVIGLLMGILLGLMLVMYFNSKK
jgi:hypothetical protein